jgi:hypothetical protein
MQVRRPENQDRSGVASRMTSSTSSRSRAAASAFSNAAMYSSSSARLRYVRLGDLISGGGYFLQPDPGPLQGALH